MQRVGILSEKGRWMSIKKYLEFIELPNPGHKTKIFKIVNHHGQYLAKIFWYAPWRQYCWNGGSDIIWSTGCDKQRTEFIDELNRQHRESLKKLR